uniref:Uncharacterized protein n=1 Tax=Ditylenchus dipsaci TaxID=166011 RepID=A0A915EI98_9BILA
MPSSTTGSFKSPSFKSFRASKSSSKRARKKELESTVEDTNNNDSVEPTAENSAVAQLKKKHPLVSSRSLLRIGLLKNRNNQTPALPIAGQELSSSSNNNNNSAPATRRKMTQRASSLSDFFHHSSVGTPTRPLPASSMAAAAMSANRRTSKPFSTAVPFLPLTCEPSSSQSSNNSAANSSSFCCSALRKSRSRGNGHSTAHAIASSNATVLGLPNMANATDAMTPNMELPRVGVVVHALNLPYWHAQVVSQRWSILVVWRSIYSVDCNLMPDLLNYANCPRHSLTLRMVID